MRSNKKYWKGLEELQNDTGFIKLNKNEFASPIQVEEFIGDDSLGETSTSRRDFLKFLGFSVGAATLAACETPVNKSLPYLIKPEEIIPGVANWYASTYTEGNDCCSILVKTMEGRPIHIKGNELSPVTKGALNARVQASVLSLYDSARLKGPVRNGEPSTWDVVDAEVRNKLNSIVGRGGRIRIVSSSLASPSTKKVIEDFALRYNNPATEENENDASVKDFVKHITYDAVSFDGMIRANEKYFGKRDIPSYRFDKAGLIVSFGADFLANWLSPIEFSRQYGEARTLKDKKKMAKHIQLESILTLTGSNADERIPVKPTEQEAALLNLFFELSKLKGAPANEPLKLTENLSGKITDIAGQLWSNKGKALVVSGSNNVAIQTVVAGINNLLESYGNTIELNSASLLHQSSDLQVSELIREMQNGEIDALILYNVNPAYTLPNAEEFATALKKVELTVSFADRMDETASLVQYVCPDHHYLESWNDANPRTGEYSLAQPVISPLFNTRQAQESLLRWAEIDMDYHSYIRKYWKENLFPRQNKEFLFDTFWNKSLHDGVFTANDKTETKSNPDKAEEENPEEKTKRSLLQPGVIDEIKRISAPAGDMELILYEKTGIGNGNHANNPWLQELPDPVSKVCWDNYLTMNPKQMQERNFNIKQGQVEKADVVELTANGKTVKVPVFPQPGQAYGTVGLALGYGRKGAGKAGDGIGVNAYPFVNYVNNAFSYYVTNVKISGAVGKYHLASTQTHHTMMGRAPVRATTLEKYIKDPKSGNPDVLISTVDHKKKKPKDVNLWKNFPMDGHRWNLSVDLNSCIGCGACVIACSSENNVPVVGKDEIRRSREMHWIRIDRYYSTDGEEGDLSAMEVPSTAENLEVVFQPVMCQHCNHAPCETVCPVLATVHSSDGLNQMIYNRCVGTKYCMNNCPYKVRRFNWFSYTRDNRFTNVNPAQDDIGRMVLNPDVVVRSRGVMEKCSMCIQKIQEGKLTAKMQRRKLKDGDIQTACAEACPTNAITFGDGNDPENTVSQIKKDPRSYYLLEELNVQPSVNYLTKVKNKNKV